MPQKSNRDIDSIKRLLQQASSIEVERVGSGHSVKCLDEHRHQFARLVIEVQQKKGVPTTFVSVIDRNGRKTTLFYGEQPLAFFKGVTEQKLP